MSLKLLYKLNGDKKGELLNLLNTFDKEPQIAWYPSSGEDFRDLLYLSEAYYKKEAIKFKAPEIFIHTDYFPWKDSKLFDDTEIRYLGTTIKVKHKEWLPSQHLTLDKDIVDFPDGSIATHKVVFTILSIDSNELGKWDIPLLYVFSENAAFANELALPAGAKFSHIINVRYGGGGFGGGRSSGIWIKNILKRIRCKLLITDNHYFEQEGDLRVYELYPDLIPEDEYTLETIRITPQVQWDGYNDVCWELVK